MLPPMSVPSAVKNTAAPHSPCQCCHCPTTQLEGSDVQSVDSTLNNDAAAENTGCSPGIPEHHGHARHSHTKLLRDKHTHQRPVYSDQFDYEEKYPPDDEYQEMSETGRVFRAYVEECTKFDFDMVENWRDGLDMLLVFAALFSAVVTTFLVQTCQSLRVDYAQMTASLILRLIDVEVAISEGVSLKKFQQNTDPFASFKANSSDLWVNGLWLTSLALSLTTTLIAVLTKQWINEYMVMPSGTPRYRSRVRHFRYMGLEQWRVPLIIGLLPVLMHVSLGVFFVGLVLFVWPLSSTIAVALGCMTGVGVLTYLITNILPLFYSNCAYKTPLSLYAFAAINCLRRRMTSLRLHRAGKPTMCGSLKDVERKAVSTHAEKLDALSVSWLHNTSSNASVQSVAVQALGSLPLENIGIVTGPQGITAPVSDPAQWYFLDVVEEEEEERPAVILAIRAHHRIDQPVDRLERMQRAALRFGAFNMVSHADNKYDFIYHRSPQRSIDLVRGNLLDEENFCGDNTLFDVVFWGKIFEAALRSGLEFLDVESTWGDGPPSSLWSQLLMAVVRDHDCLRSNCEGKEKALFSYSLGPQNFPLSINQYDLHKDGTTRSLVDALSNNMRASFVKWVLHVAFPDATKSNLATKYPHLPKDILLVLTMLQTKSIQATSSLPHPYSRDSLFQKVLEAVEEYAFDIGQCKQHQEIDRATISVLRAVVGSDAFGTSTVMTLADEAMLVEILFSALNRRFEFSGAGDRDPSWLTPSLFGKVWRIASAASKSEVVFKGWTVVAHIFAYVSHFESHFDVTETIYSYLLQDDWLHELSVAFPRLSKSITPESDKLPKYWCPGYIFIATTYIEVLSTHSSRSSEIFAKARAYIMEPAHLSTLASIFLLSDCSTQERLWHLAKMTADTPSAWSDCVKDLSKLASCKGVKEEYAYVRLLISVDLHAHGVQYRPVDELPGLVSTFAADIERKQYLPPGYKGLEGNRTATTQASSRTQGLTKSWWEIFWHM